MNELHCATCDAVITAGSAQCPGCGLQMTTNAHAAVYVEKARWPLWPIILGAVVLFFIAAHELDRHGAVKAAAAKEAFVADWDSGRLNSAEAFIARCDKPRMIDKHGVLHYNSGGIGDFLVSFPIRIDLEHVALRSEKPETYTTKIRPEQAFSLFHCR